MSVKTLWVALLVLIAPLWMPTWAEAQPAGSELQVVVLDPSGAVIAGARVSLTSVDDDEPEGPDYEAASSDEGLAVFQSLEVGAYTIRVEFPGFETVEVRGYRLRAGNHRRSITLPLANVEEGVNVGRDGQDAALDPGGSAFATVLTREQIDALPDDPDEMEAVLRAMSPAGATIRIDGFSGGRLPAKSQIRSIRLPRGDMFAAQHHGGIDGASFIDIVTQPGLGRLGGSIDTAFRDDALTATNPFTPEKGAESLREYGLNVSGPIVSGRSSFLLSTQVGRQLDAGTLLAALPNGTRNTSVDQVTRTAVLFARFDQAIGTAHTLRASYSGIGSDGSGLGAGGYDLPDRAYSNYSREHLVRISESGPIGRSLFSDVRLQIRRSTRRSASLVEAQTTQVLDAFTSGGAQRRGGRSSLEIEAAADVDYVRGAHAYRAGILVEAARHRSDELSNYLGTYTFSSLADFEANRPSHYGRRTGDPRIRYDTLRLGAYLQDDFRVSRSVLVSYGLRYEAQSFSSDRFNLSPRGSIAWAPFRSGNTTVRAGFGVFNDWIPTAVYEQARTVDGLRLREISIPNPTNASVDDLDGVIPSSRYELDARTKLPGSYGLNLGVSQTVASDLRLSATYARRTGWDQLRGLDVNAPIDGVRPNSRFAEIVHATGDAASRADLLMFDASLGKPRWHRLFAGINYTLASTRSNSAGAFARPAVPEIAREWGVTGPRHRIGASVSMRFGAVGVSASGRMESGRPYTLTSGLDANGDGVFNDRPEGVERNSLRTPATWDIGGRLSYVLGFGRGRTGPNGGDVFVVRAGGGSGMPAGFDGGAEDARVRLEFYVSAQNLTNRRNYTGYSGVLTSPFFGQPTNVSNPRKVQMGMRLSF